MDLPSEFYINCEKSRQLTLKSVDWFIRSWKFKHGSLEWQICRLKREIYMRDAIKLVKEATELCQKEKN